MSGLQWPGQIQSIPTEVTTQPVISMASAPSTVVSTSPISTFISEEVVISEPATTSTVPIDNQVEVLVQGGGGIVVYTPQDASDTILQADVETEDIVQQSSVEGMTLETQDVIVQQSYFTPISWGMFTFPCLVGKAWIKLLPTPSKWRLI